MTLSVLFLVYKLDSLQVVASTYHSLLFLKPAKVHHFSKNSSLIGFLSLTLSLFPLGIKVINSNNMRRRRRRRGRKRKRHFFVKNGIVGVDPLRISQSPMIVIWVGFTSKAGFSSRIWVQEVYLKLRKAKLGSRERKKKCNVSVSQPWLLWAPSAQSCWDIPDEPMWKKPQNHTTHGWRCRVLIPQLPLCLFLVWSCPLRH